MNFIFRILLTMNATSWLIVIYEIKEGVCLLCFPRWTSALMLLLIPVILTLLSIFLSNYLGNDRIEECSECTLVDNEFLQVYLGYFFVALSVSDCFTLIVVYGIVFVFTYLTQSLYFNPLFLLFGYHFYRVRTRRGTMVIIALKGRVIRNVGEVDLSHLKRVNDMSYIAMKGVQKNELLICETADDRKRK